MLTVKGEKIMNIATSFIAIVSLLLALATADMATKQQSEEQTPAAAAEKSPSKIALNHNETMVSDAPLAQNNNAESVRQFQPRVALWQPWENGSHFLKAQL
jgi:methionine-rich copper-binding protein CopC